MSNYNTNDDTNSENNSMLLHLIILLKMFNDRPNHLARYLLEHDAFTDIFMDKLTKSEILSKFSTIQTEHTPIPFFTDIKSMEDYYSSLVNNKIDQNIIDDLNLKLASALIEERYEDAAEIRDYMIKIGVKNKR